MRRLTSEKGFRPSAQARATLSVRMEKLRHGAWKVKTFLPEGVHVQTGRCTRSMFCGCGGAVLFVLLVVQRFDDLKFVQTETAPAVKPSFFFIFLFKGGMGEHFSFSFLFLGNFLYTFPC
ncbi:MAG: hypothetical protein J6W75_01075 [Bacteroidaceae bacterium]|nr:hypothetical protein [Bacteroidaceae bacterium]